MSTSCAQSFQSCPTLWTVARQAPVSMGFSRQEYWRGLPCPPPGDLPDPGIEPSSLVSPALAGRFFTTTTTWEARWLCHSSKGGALPPSILFHSQDTRAGASSGPTTLVRSWQGPHVHPSFKGRGRHVSLR